VNEIGHDHDATTIRAAAAAAAAAADGGHDMRFTTAGVTGLFSGLQ